MTEQQKKDLLYACELAERITAETVVNAQVEFNPGSLDGVSAYWYLVHEPDALGKQTVDGCRSKYGLEQIIPYLETVLQTAPRKPAPKEESR